MMRLLMLFLFIIVSIPTFAVTTLKGYVKDHRSGEALVGAAVHLKNTSFGAAVGLDGSFAIRNVPAGSYVIAVSMIGYSTVERSITVQDKNEETLAFSLQESSSQLNEVIVTGIAEQGSELSTRLAEQKADNVVNIIGSKSIQLLPDLTVGNLLQRVSGVSMVRNGSGDGQFAIIRGMDKRYNYTLVNGIKIPSPDNKNRYVPMDIFPSDLLERLEVIKALTPSMEGDAIGGAMNMIMKSAPDYLVINATASMGYSDLFASRDFSGFSTKGVTMKSPSEIHSNAYEAQPSDFSIKSLQYKTVPTPVNGLMSFSIGNRVLNHKLGFLVGGSYQHMYRGSNSSFFRLNGQPGPDPTPNTPIFEFVEKRTYSNEQTRLGTNVKLDYNFNKRNKISLFALYMQTGDWQHRQVLNNQLTLIGDVGISDRSQYRKQNVVNSTLQGDHVLSDKLKFNWSGVYSVAKSTTPDWTDMQVTYRTTLDTEGNKVESARYIEPVTHIWTHNEDRDLAGYANFSYDLKGFVEVSAGGMYRDKHRSNFYNDYSLATVLPGSDRQIYTSIDKAQFSFRPESYAYADSTNANNYTAHEQIAAGYLQGKISLSRLQILGGVRAESTHQSYMSQLPVTATGKTGSISYIDVLPSVHFKYMLNAKQNLRLSYFKGISRPGFFEIVPASFPGDYFNESGNYNLKHTTSDNLDLRYEFYSGKSDQFSAGAFYKNIQNPIEYGFSIVNQTVTVYSPLNFGTATNYGAEVVFVKFFNKFGVSGNYTYTQSQITTTKRVYGRDASGSIVNTEQKQTRPLQGQSAHIANLSLIYKNTNIGFDAQISAVYTGPRINIVSPFLGLDYWQRGTSQVDFSAEKKVGQKFSFFLKATNLLNNAIIVEVLKPNTLANLPEQTRSDRILVQKDVFQQTFLLGARFKY